MNSPYSSPVDRAFGDLIGRLKVRQPFSIAIVLVPFFAAAVLAIYSAFESSIRYRSDIQPLTYNAQKSVDHKIWMSVGLSEDTILIKTSSGAAFKWSAAGPSEADYNNFEVHLKDWAKKHLESVIIAGQFEDDTNTAAISVDQRLTFHHVRPIIYALAAAGISKYGFETKLTQ